MTRPLNVLSLFSGIGGLELGLERAGMRLVGQVEIDDYCRRVLAKHWPDVPRHDDVRTAAEWWQSRKGQCGDCSGIDINGSSYFDIGACRSCGGRGRWVDRPAVDVVCGGFPCQPVSLTGRGLANRDPHWLWPAFRDIVDTLRPTWVIGENVVGLRTRGLVDITSDLEALGYAVETRVATACAVGAPHARARLFIVANSAGIRRWTGLREGNSRPEAGTLDLAITPNRPAWPAEPSLPRVANGLPDWVDRRRALGNAVVPAVAEYVGQLIVNHAASATA